ncbi:MAG: DUF3048 domain-containing protein [Ardenticatenaceae bacterium]|nr:DUF3048 domain-containing protein [Ardenticatenaceae bacterium]MCB9445459.1 DUF3048 domain-containing protein [Ardenticatenaceae bacterium]
MQKIWQLMLMFILLAGLAACGGQDESPGLLPTPTPLDSAAIVGATPTTAVPSTNTPLPPPPTMVAPPTATQLPASPTPAAISLLTAADFGADRNPLTGEVVDDPGLLQQRPLAVKISNAPPSYVRPQSGLNDAAIIYEHLAEGSLTRFTAIFYGKLPEKIGPIRSARLIDIELPAMYDAALFFSGASVGVNQRLNSSDFSERVMRSAEEGFYRTGEDKPIEHTLYGDPEGFYRALDTKGLNVPPQFNNVMTFSSEPPEGGQPASQVSIDYQWEVVEWRYNEEDGRYYRWAAGQPHLDGNTNEQVNAANIIIISPYHVEDPTICEEAHDGKCVALSVQIQLWGSGGGIILRDGQQYLITWHRESRNDLLTFTDAAGNPFPLQIGNSWVQLVPNWYNDPVTVTP